VGVEKFNLLEKTTDEKIKYKRSDGSIKFMDIPEKIDVLEKTAG